EHGYRAALRRTGRSLRRRPILRRGRLAGRPDARAPGENNVHGGAPTSIVDVRKLPNGPLTTEVRIKGYTYRPGDLSLLGQPGARIPTVRQGHSLLFVNQDHPGYEWHTITACRVPCNGSTGIAFPLA